VDGGGTAQYATAAGGKVEKLATGYTKHWRKGELATVKTGLGAAGTAKKGAVFAWAELPGSSGSPAVGVPQPVPGKRTLYLSAANGVTWLLDFEQYGAEDEEGFPLLEAYYTTGDSRAFKAGRTYAQTFNVGILGPRINGTHGIRRDGAYLYGLLPMFADGRGHAGASLYEKVTTTLYRDGEKIASGEDALDGSGKFKVPPGRAVYRLTTSLSRSADLARVSSRIDASWTFTSEKTVRDTKPPVSTVRFGAPFLASTAPLRRAAAPPSASPCRARPPSGTSSRCPCTCRATAGSGPKSRCGRARSRTGRRPRGRACRCAPG
jgi:hypothetical protein